jgi:hypothetical protein
LQATGDLPTTRLLPRHLRDIAKVLEKAASMWALWWTGGPLALVSGTAEMFGKENTPWCAMTDYVRENPGRQQRREQPAPAPLRDVTSENRWAIRRHRRGE